MEESFRALIKCFLRKYKKEVSALAVKRIFIFGECFRRDLQ
jgi:hypothetical protein